MKIYICSNCGQRHKSNPHKPYKCQKCGHNELYKECEPIDDIFRKNGLIY